MEFKLESIDFYVRETKPARFASALGKAATSGQKPQRVTSPICHVRLHLSDSTGRSTWGCSADRLSVRWLDKRPGRDIKQKRVELARLLNVARERYLAHPEIESVFAAWFARHAEIMQAGSRSNQEALTAAFVSSLLERALVDAACRLANQPLFVMLKAEKLGFDPGLIHPELKASQLASSLPGLPLTDIAVRHTVGIYDPLSDEDWPTAKRLDDGLPETIKEYIEQDGIRYFKVKISGNEEFDLRRLNRVWEILATSSQPEITLDANEAFSDAEVFARFVRRLESENLGLFQHISFIEQPLARSAALQPTSKKWIQQVASSKAVIIDESDGTLDACRRALEIGYSGTSHKNCKGLFKSLASQALLAKRAAEGKRCVMSAEDLQNLPIVPLQQDLAMVGILGIHHCERNGHHYNHGLSMLSPKDKAYALREHADLYEQRNDEGYLKIQNGMLDCMSVHCPGFAVMQEPDWDSMQPLQAWLEK